MTTSYERVERWSLRPGNMIVYIVAGPSENCYCTKNGSNSVSLRAVSHNRFAEKNFFQRIRDKKNAKRRLRHCSLSNTEYAFYLLSYFCSISVFIYLCKIIIHVLTMKTYGYELGLGWVLTKQEKPGQLILKRSCVYILLSKITYVKL